MLEEFEFEGQAVLKELDGQEELEEPEGQEELEGRESLEEHILDFQVAIKLLCSNLLAVCYFF